MSKEKRPVEIVVAEFNTEAAASAALKILKGQLQLKDAAVIGNDNGKVKVKETRDMGGGKGASVGVILATGDQINIIIIGRGDPPAFADLVANLNSKLQHPVKVNLDIIPSTSMTSP